MNYYNVDTILTRAFVPPPPPKKKKSKHNKKYLIGIHVLLASQPIDSHTVSAAACRVVITGVSHFMLRFFRVILFDRCVDHLTSRLFSNHGMKLVLVWPFSRSRCSELVPTTSHATASVLEVVCVVCITRKSALNIRAKEGMCIVDCLGCPHER